MGLPACLQMSKALVEQWLDCDATTTAPIWNNDDHLHQRSAACLSSASSSQFHQPQSSSVHGHHSNVASSQGSRGSAQKRIKDANLDRYYDRVVSLLSAVPHKDSAVSGGVVLHGRQSPLGGLGSNKARGGVLPVATAGRRSTRVTPSPVPALLDACIEHPQGGLVGALAASMTLPLLQRDS